jgi:hypothetical protein
MTYGFSGNYNYVSLEQSIKDIKEEIAALEKKREEKVHTLNEWKAWKYEAFVEIRLDTFGHRSEYTGLIRKYPAHMPIQRMNAFEFKKVTRWDLEKNPKYAEHKGTRAKLIAWAIDKADKFGLKIDVWFHLVPEEREWIGERIGYDLGKEVGNPSGNPLERTRVRRCDGFELIRFGGD